MSIIFLFIDGVGLAPPGKTTLFRGRNSLFIQFAGWKNVDSGCSRQNL